jgi:hypothetical protein
MIIIPTSELLGLITDVIGFAPASKDNPDCGILIEWDGDRLHAAAYDVLSAGRATWLPGEGDESEAAEGDPSDKVNWGSDEDSPWRVFISAEDAREIVKTFKLPAKFRLVPLLVKCSMSGGSLFVERQKETGRTAHIAMFRSDIGRAAKFPDVRAIVLDAEVNTSPVAMEGFSPSRLTAFGGVRAYDVMRITFGAAGQPSAVSIGSRFIGFIYSARPESVNAGRARHVTGSMADVRDVRVEIETPPADVDNE